MVRGRFYGVDLAENIKKLKKQHFSAAFIFDKMLKK